MTPTFPFRKYEGQERISRTLFRMADAASLLEQIAAQGAAVRDAKSDKSRSKEQNQPVVILDM